MYVVKQRSGFLQALGGKRSALPLLLRISPNLLRAKCFLAALFHFLVEHPHTDFHPLGFVFATTVKLNRRQVGEGLKLRLDLDALLSRRLAERLSARVLRTPGRPRNGVQNERLGLGEALADGFFAAIAKNVVDVPLHVESST